MRKGPVLRTVEDWPDAWQAGFLPWLKEVACRSMIENRATILVAPDYAALRFARSLALEAGINAPALHFLTPSHLRDFLRDKLHLTKPHALRETSRLLLAAAAEQFEGETALAVAAAPDSVLRSIDLLGAAGWDFSETAPEALRPILAEFTRLRNGAGFAMLDETDRGLAELAGKCTPMIAELCLVGFDAAHWAMWPLLSAAVRSSERASIFLRLPTDSAADLDALWIGTWEQEFSSAEPLHVSETERDSPAPRFLVAEDTAEEARAVVQQAFEFLADPKCSRLAILFPGPGALARRVAAEFATRNLPHFDSIGHVVSLQKDAADWTAWIELQENPRLPALLRFLRAFPRCAALFEGVEGSRVADALTTAFRKTLLDDFAVLAAFAPEYGDGIRAIPRLPDCALFGEFVTQTIEACERLGWPNRIDELRQKTNRWAASLDVKISRRSFLRWLSEVLPTGGRGRSEAGNHPYSRTHLLTAAQAGAQTWSHVIVAGMNQGHWPAAFTETGWISEAVIGDLNSRVRVLNRRARRGGRQGEGHETIAAGKALCLGPNEKRALALRDFDFAFAGGRAVAFTASTTDEKASDRVANPAEFLSRVYFKQTGHPLSRKALQRLQNATKQWLISRPSASGELTVRHPEVEAAYLARRDRTAKFGPYEFALSNPPAELPRLNATDWERVLKSPALVWMNYFLGVRRREDDSDETPWAAAIGDWVHKWLRTIVGSTLPGMFEARPKPDEILQKVEQAAKQLRDRVTAEVDLPEWWSATWSQARQIARDLAGHVARVDSRYSSLATESPLPENTVIDIADGLRLAVRGRLDLILSAAKDVIWIIDYKTGRNGKLTQDKLLQGDGLQLSLYALALEASGAKTIGLSRLTRDLNLAEPQIVIESSNRAEPSPLLKALALMGGTGVFGSKGKLRDEYSFSDELPLATLRIPADVLKAKWSLTHPDLAVTSK